MLSNPIISIITPVFNSVTYIEACIQNVINQQCEKVEHLIIDGGSTDGTAKIISQYANQYRHIHWFSEKDCGQSDAMNKGIRIASGSFIGFLNVDDYYEPKILRRINQAIHQHNVTTSTLFLGNLKQINEWGDIIHIRKPLPLSLKNVLQFWEFEAYPANPVSYFYHKSLHEKIGYYDIDQHYTMDYDFFLRVAPIADVKYYDEIWGTYRMIPGAKTVEIGKHGGPKAFKEDLFWKYIHRLSYIEYIVVVLRFLIFYLLGKYVARLRYRYSIIKSKIKVLLLKAVKNKH